MTFHEKIPPVAEPYPWFINCHTIMKTLCAARGKKNKAGLESTQNNFTGISDLKNVQCDSLTETFLFWIRCGAVQLKKKKSLKKLSYKMNWISFKILKSLLWGCIEQTWARFEKLQQNKVFCWNYSILFCPGVVWNKIEINVKKIYSIFFYKT